MNKDKKTALKFFGIIFSAVIVGFVCGLYSAKYGTDLAGAVQLLLDNLVKISPYLMYGSALPMAAAAMYYIKGKKAAWLAISGDEQRYDIADNLLEKSLARTMYMTIYSFMVFGVMTSGFAGKFTMEHFLSVMVALGYFIAILAAMTVLQRMIVKQVKAMNPEKRGNVLDTKFKKDWYESCDEREKAVIGAASYKAYQAGNTAILVVWMLLVFAGFVLPIGPLPVIGVTAVWFVMYRTYVKEAEHRQEHKKR